MTDTILRYIRSVEPIPADSSLEACYDYCRRINRAYGKSFYAASLSIPRAKRRGINALYGFLRLGDEIADSSSSPDQSKRDLDLLRQMVLRAYAEDRSPNPILRAFINTATVYRIPERHAMRFLDSMEMDICGRRYETIEELREYTYGCASVVGILVTYVLGYSDEKAFGYAKELGHAMQMTNFLRDMKEDIGRGRIYLPAADLAGFGVTVGDIERGRMTEPLRALIRHHLERTRLLYSLVDSGYCFFQSDGARFVYAARLLYSKILDRIEALNYDVFQGRAVVPMAVKLLISLRVRLTGVERLCALSRKNLPQASNGINE